MVNMVNLYCSDRCYAVDRPFSLPLLVPFPPTVLRSQAFGRRALSLRRKSWIARGGHGRWLLPIFAEKEHTVQAPRSAIQGVGGSAGQIAVWPVSTPDHPYGVPPCHGRGQAGIPLRIPSLHDGHALRRYAAATGYGVLAQWVG